MRFSPQFISEQAKTEYINFLYENDAKREQNGTDSHPT